MVVADRGIPEYFRPEYYDEINSILRLESEPLEALKTYAASAANDDHLRGTIMRLRDALFRPGGGEAVSSETARSLMDDAAKPFGRDAGMFHAIVLLSEMRAVRDRYRQRRIPDDILIDTFSDVGVWMRHSKQNRGVWGIGVPGWLFKHVACRLFKIGRLQYYHMPWDKKAHVYRHRTTGRLSVFPAGGVRIRRDGWVDGTNGRYDEEGAWDCFFEAGEDVIVGHPTTDEGRVLRERATLPAGEWEPLLREGSPVLDVHVQEGEKLDPEQVRDSMRRALTFYRSHFPELEAKAFVCTSWLLCPAFSRILPPESNIAAFRRTFRLVPHKDNDAQLFERVFGTDRATALTMPARTRLQRIVLDQAAKGEELVGGSGFLPAYQVESP